MKAKTIKFLNTKDVENDYFGIEISMGKQKYFAKDNKGAIISKDKQAIINRVRDFNKKMSKPLNKV